MIKYDAKFQTTFSSVSHATTWKVSNKVKVNDIRLPKKE